MWRAVLWATLMATLLTFTMVAGMQSVPPTGSSKYFYRSRAAGEIAPCKSNNNHSSQKDGCHGWTSVGSAANMTLKSFTCTATVPAVPVAIGGGNGAHSIEPNASQNMYGWGRPQDLIIPPDV